MSRSRIAVVTLVATAGCVQILGLHDRSEATDGGSGANDSVFEAGRGGSSTAVAGQCGELLHSSASCASCMDQSCCAEARACAGDAACREASDCLASCADATCRAQCAAFYTLPDSLIALRACRVRACAAPCESSCGEFASALPACQACEEASCCSQGTTCATDTTCAALSLCVSNCFGAASCPTACETKYSQGATDYGAWFNCTDQCASVCQPGQSWSCLDSPIIWPKPTAVGNVTFSVTFVNFTSEQPFVGATVKACNKLDFSCATPLDRATSDATGLVSLTVPTGTSGFDGYLDVTGGSVGGTGAPAFPAIWYPVPFVVADGWRGRTLLLSADEVVALTMATGTVPDPTRGHVALNAADCVFGPAAGVSFLVDSADQETVSYYLVGGVPVTTATATDQSGIGTFLNLPTTAPARLTVVRAFSGTAGGKSMGSLTFIVRPGTVTTSSSFPPMP